MLRAAVGPAAAAPSFEPAVQSMSVTSALTMNIAEISQGTTADRVQNAQSLQEALRILESDGYVQTSTEGEGFEDLRIEKTMGGVSVGFMLPSPKIAQPLMSGGWNWGKGGPCAKGTMEEWKAVASGGAIVGGAACAFITAAVGAAACIAAAGLVGQ